MLYNEEGSSTVEISIIFSAVILIMVALIMLVYRESGNMLSFILGGDRTMNRYEPCETIRNANDIYRFLIALIENI